MYEDPYELHKPSAIQPEEDWCQFWWALVPLLLFLWLTFNGRVDNENSNCFVRRLGCWRSHAPALLRNARIPRLSLPAGGNRGDGGRHGWDEPPEAPLTQRRSHETQTRLAHTGSTRGP